MSDVFGTSLYDDPAQRLSSAIVLYGPEKDAAIHAIANHDKLTIRVAELEFSLDDRDCYIADADMKNEELVKRVAELEKLGSDMADELEANYNNQRTRIMFMKWNKKLKESE